MFFSTPLHMTMDKVVDFIRDFHPSKLGLGLSDILLTFFCIAAGPILISWLVSFLSLRTANFIRTAFKWTLTILGYGVVLFILLNAVLTEDYGNVFVAIILIAASRIDHWYKFYDRFVDKKINNDN
jgi:hypothetical protein